MKKQKLPGENISLKTKKNESAVIMDWINSQSNLMDSIRYLIENELRANGLRNLQHYIPSDRPLAIPASVLGLGEAAAASEPLLSSTTLATAAQELAASNSIGHAANAQQSVLQEAAATKTVGQAVADDQSAAQQAGAEIRQDEPAAVDEIDEEDIESWL
ncbi:hypothetical protein ACFFNY_21630 [Paenibacillus hodogayensis]|uniref:Uncharacterized protein n=1 Tax=Paenibacillus hodogayensis TaxID=279208 RepID=A0ABV5W1I3_9BACL